MIMSSANLECHLAQDLLIPYLAGDVSPETRSWLEAHLAGCEPCAAVRQSLTPTPGAMPPPAAAPLADPGRKVVGRVRRQVWILVALLVVFLGIGVGGIAWGISSVGKWANMPADHPAPASTVTPEALAEQARTLSRNGLVYEQTLPSLHGSRLIFRDPVGNPVVVDMKKAESTAEAREEFDQWFRSFRSHMLSVDLHTPSSSRAKFRSGPSYYYGWQTLEWTFTIQVPSEVENPTALRDEVRDGLFEVIRGMR